MSLVTPISNSLTQITLPTYGQRKFIVLILWALHFYVLSTKNLRTLTLHTAHLPRKATGDPLVRIKPDVEGRLVA